MINITIDGTLYRIETDKQCWTLREQLVHKVTGALRWSDPLGYYLRLEQLADKLLKLGATDPLVEPLALLAGLTDALRANLGPYPPRPPYEELG